MKTKHPLVYDYGIRVTPENDRIVPRWHTRAVPHIAKEHWKLVIDDDLELMDSFATECFKYTVDDSHWYQFRIYNHDWTPVGAPFKPINDRVCWFATEWREAGKKYEKKFHKD